MTNKIDKSKCASLVVEAALLIQNTRLKYGTFAKMHDRPRRIYKKSFHRFYRRVHALDTIVAESAGEEQEIYLGQCEENTPPERQRSLVTPAWNVINFDISEFAKR